MAGSAVCLDEASVADMAGRLDTDGVVCLDGVVSPDWLDGIRAAIPGYLAAHGERDFLIVDDGAGVDTPIRRLVGSPALQSVLTTVAAMGCPDAADTERLRAGLAIRSGWTDKAPGNLFHYDASVLTMVVPIVIPRAELGRSGELVAVPNKRPFRRRLIAHVVDKLLTHNPVYRGRVARHALRHAGNSVVQLRPGNAYLFWGYRTLHGNFPCAPGLVRVTLIVQVGGVHREGIALSAIRKVRGRGLRGRQVVALAPPDPEAAEPSVAALSMAG